MGIGGRPGTFAFFSNFFTTIIAWLVSLIGFYTVSIEEIFYNPLEYQVIDIYIYIFGPLIAALGSVGIYWVANINDNFTKIAGNIGPYTVIGLYGSMLLETFKTPFYTKPSGNVVSYGQYFINYWHVGVLIGITERKMFKKWIKGYNFHNYIIAGYIGGWILTSLQGLVSFGGKHGLVALLANNVLIRLLDLCNYYCFFDSEVNTKKSNTDNINNENAINNVENENKENEVIIPTNKITNDKDDVNVFITSVLKKSITESDIDNKNSHKSNNSIIQIDTNSLLKENEERQNDEEIVYELKVIRSCEINKTPN